ncbi:MAG: uracil-DNA glycosylase family protein, partial [Sulfobacillus sp.]
MESWPDLIERAQGCVACRLAHGRQRVVFGAGNPKALLMLVGEAPGHDEDLAGEPFVGRAGELLTRILAAVALSRD